MAFTAFEPSSEHATRPMRPAGMTLYVLIAMRYDERDLVRLFGVSYTRCRASA